MKDSESHDPARKQGSGVAPPPPEKSHDATGSQGVPDTTPPPLEKSRRRRITEISACVVGFLSILFIITVGEWHRGMASSSEPSLGGSELAGDTAGLRVLIWTDRGSATGMSLAEFTDALKDDTKLGKPVFESLGRLTAWLTESTIKDGKLVKDGELFRDLVFLKLLQDILNFEMNRPLEYWYGHLPQFPGATFQKAADELPDGELKMLLTAYGNNCMASVMASKVRWKASQAVSPGGKPSHQQTGD